MMGRMMGGRISGNKKRRKTAAKTMRIGGAEGNRTPDLCSAIAALSHLSYSPDLTRGAMGSARVGWGSFMGDPRPCQAARCTKPRLSPPRCARPRAPPVTKPPSKPSIHFVARSPLAGVDVPRDLGYTPIDRRFPAPRPSSLDPPPARSTPRSAFPGPHTTFAPKHRNEGRIDIAPCAERPCGSPGPPRPEDPC